jgi:hypothetical protein
MTRFIYDRFAKNYLEGLLSPLGEVKTSLQVPPGEVREIDVYFMPSFTSNIDVEKLGLLGSFAAQSAIFEPFRNAATVGEIRSCMNKMFDIFAELQRDAKSAGNRLLEDDLPRLWILSPTASENVLNGFKASLDEEKWGAGVYLLGDYLRTAIVAIHQLPRTQETLWLRILGKGRVQQRAIQELEALPQDNPLRSQAINLLLNLKTTLELSQNVDEEDRELFMQIANIYEQVKQEGREEGRQEAIQTERRTTIENALRVRFGSMDEELMAIIEQLVALSPEEFMPLLFQLSREDLLARFR